MKNYDEMSNAQINKHVARANNVEWVAVAQDGLIVDGKSLSVDYCNNPEDAWPIIVDNAISITSVGDLNWNADSIISIEEDADNYNHFQCISNCTSQNKNPLRAAMICFLKMKDAENGKQ